MGIISGIAKGARTMGIKKDNALETISTTQEKIQDKFVNIKDSTATKLQDIKGNIFDPKAFIKKQWGAGKMQAELGATQKKDFEKTIVPLPTAPSQTSSSKRLEKDQDKLTQEELKKLRNTSPDESEKRLKAYLSILVMFAIVIHIIDTASGVMRFNQVVFISYLLMLTFSFFAISKGHFDPQFDKLFLFTVFAFVFPRAIGLLNNISLGEITKYITGLTILFPVLVFYLFKQFPDHSFINKATTIYLTIWVFVGIALLLTSSGASFIWSPVGSIKMITNPWGAVSDLLSMIGKSFAKLGSGLGTTWNRMIASATGQPYEGEEQSVNGLFLKNIKVIDEGRLYTGRDIILEGILEIRTSNRDDYTPISITNKCYEQNVQEFTALPSEVVMSGNDEKIIRCTTSHLREGSHNIIFTSNFNYYTEGTINYWFISNERSYSDYANIADIPKKTTATYSGGPVDLGLRQYTQPMMINPSGDTTYQFGISLNNKWASGAGSGKITQGYKFMLEVPNVLTLTDCTRKIVSTENSDETNTIRYYFDMDETQAMTYFDSVNCVMSFNNAHTWLDAAPGQAIVLEFKGAAWYGYELKQEKSINVESLERG